jgi:hypothetical protein
MKYFTLGLVRKLRHAQEGGLWLTICKTFNIKLKKFIQKLTKKLKKTDFFWRDAIYKRTP